jgi:hypothetical protein
MTVEKKHVTEHYKMRRYTGYCQLPRAVWNTIECVDTQDTANYLGQSETL